MQAHTRAHVKLEERKLALWIVSMSGFWFGSCTVVTLGETG